VSQMMSRPLGSSARIPTSKPWQSSPMTCSGFGSALAGLAVMTVRTPPKLNTVSEHTGGTLDLLINNAGYSPRDGAIEAADMTEYRRAFEVNFRGPMQVVQAMTPRLVVHPVSAG
jgi:NAD(P)-dependent dehydrogenase (short-subunit alcohol dehydrogenase family)